MAFKSVNLASMLVGSLMIAAFAGIGCLPHAAIAKAEMSSTKSPAETKPPAPKPAASMATESGASLIEQLKLTPKQKSQIAGFRANRTRQINQVLTPEQRKEFEAARKSGKSFQAALKAVNLKPDQKTKILDIAKKSADSIKAALTPEQKKQLEVYLKKQASQHNPGATVE